MNKVFRENNYHLIGRSIVYKLRVCAVAILCVLLPSILMKSFYEMSIELIHFSYSEIALKTAISAGIGLLIGLEREWSNKDVGVRTFAIIALLGMLAALIGQDIMIVSFVGVCLLVAAMNARNIICEGSLEVTTSAALLVNFILGALVGLGHIFTPVAGAIIITMLLALKTELNRFAGGLHPSEIRGAILLGLIGFVIYPLLPNRFIDPWKLFNPSDAWIAVIAISGIGFINYVFLRLYSTKGLYLGAIFGGLVNSTATIAEVSSRAQKAGATSKITTLSSLINISMFVRNMVLAALFVPLSLAATFIPLFAMSCVAGIWIWRDHATLNQERIPDTNTLELTSPISLKRMLWFGILFIIIQAMGILLTRIFGNYGMLATGFFGGLVSSASTTVAAATMAKHGSITAALAGSAAIISSMTSALVDLPIVWKTIHDKKIVKRFTIKLISIIIVGVLAVLSDNLFHISDMLLHR